MNQLLYTDEEPSSIDGIYQIPSKELEICIRKGRRLIGYHYRNSKWEKTWNELIFQKNTELSLKDYPWMISNKLLPNKNIIIIHHPDGVRFYEINSDKSGLTLIAEDGSLHEVYTLSVLVGSFYADRSFIGIMSRNERGKVKFYAAMEESLEDEEDPLYELDMNFDLPPKWQAGSTEFVVTKLYRNNDKDLIGLRTESELEFFEFNERNQPQSVVKTPHGRKVKNNNLFLANIIGNKYQDILVLNENSLDIYSYEKNYDLISSSFEFIKYGWSLNFIKSVKFIDLNDDGRDDFVFTGSKGLRAFTFDIDTNKWTRLLNLIGPNYGNVVGYLPSILPNLDGPSLFIEDSQGNLKWNSVKYYPEQTTTSTTTERYTTASTTTTTARYNEKVLHFNEIERKEFLNKPILRWAEQLDTSFIKESVNMKNCQTGLNIPLVDASSSTGWKIQLALSYSSAALESDILGIGWYLPIAQDYIFVDYQGSIFPSEATYYLITQGSLYPLKRKSQNGEIKVYEAVIDDDIKTEVEYHRSKECWVMKGRSEEVIYGKANDDKAQEAIAYGLTWPFWRFTGNNQTHLKRIATAWYMNKRYDKNINKSLYYYYEREDGSISGYTLSVRLKSITDGLDTQVNFNYASKNSFEFTIKTTDNSGNIVLPLSQSSTKYLAECNIETYSYKQTLKFNYQIHNDKRLLTGISQLLSHDSESIFTFDYAYISEKFALKNLKLLPHEISIDFEYNSYTKPFITAIHDNIIQYFDMKKPEIGYGNDYTVLGNLKGGKVHLNILNREMTHTITDCKKLDCPEIGEAVKMYSIQAYDDAFLVLIKTETKKIIAYIYNRIKKDWSNKPTSFENIHEDDKFRFTKNVIAVAKQSSEHIELYNREDNSSDWKLTSLLTSRRIVCLTSHQKVVIGYDNQDLIVFYLDEQSKWNKNILGKFPEYEYGSRQLINRFSLKQEIKNELILRLQQGYLQMFNNFVILSELKETGGQLYFNVELFLLNDEYNIGHSRRFRIDRENIYSLQDEHQIDETLALKLNYIQENGLFKIRVKNVYGKAVDKIGNKNRKEDFAKDMMKTWNESRDFTESVFLLDWTKYRIHLTQEGVKIGDSFLRLTGADWVEESNPEFTELGDHFKIEWNKNETEFKLHRNGEIVKEMNLYETSQIVIGYPRYIAYHPDKDTINMITFKDDKNLDKERVFKGETILLNASNWQNFATMDYYDELRIRPASTLQSQEKELYVKKTILKSKDIIRKTGYNRSFHIDRDAKTYSDIVSMIPGNDEKSHGRYESIETYNGEFERKEKWFDSNNDEIYKPEDEVPETPTIDEEESKSLLLDRTNKLLISDFSPYSMKDEMCGYYGFESYEKSFEFWSFDKSRIKRKFAFTGQNYLELVDSSSVFEGKFTPADQEITYLASCWIRSTIPLSVNTAVQYLKAIVNTEDGRELIGLNAQVKLRSQDWYYLELRIDFQLMKTIYEEYLKYNKISGRTGQKFQIILRVQGKIDLDHIRFTPFTFDFQATAYHPVSGKSVSILQSNGLVTRTIYNRKHEEMAIIQENNALTRFISVNKIGSIIPTPKERPVCNIPSVLIMEPDKGFYEDFNSASLQNNWELNEGTPWAIAPGQLWHYKGKHKIKARPHVFDEKSSAIRFYYDLDFGSAITMFWQNASKMELVHQNNRIMNLNMQNEFIIHSLPVQGEIIVMLEENYLWIWVNGLLLVDKFISTELSWNSFKLEVQGKALIEDLIIMNRPKTKIEYYNSFNEKVQTVELEQVDTVKVTEVLYDEIGREAITTKTSRLKRNGSLLHYRYDFVLNKNPDNVDYVFKSGKVKGLVHELNREDEGYPFSRTDFASNPLGEIKRLGLPGKDFSIAGPYSVKFNSNSNISFINVLFPARQNYRQKVEYSSNGSIKVSVFDKFDMEIARYIKVPSYDHLLSTYDYDQDGNLIKILPPAYHEKAETYRMLKPWSERTIHRELEDKLGTFYKYDKNGNLIQKITPDDGVTEYLYNSIGLLRFMVSLGRNNRTNRVIYYNYDRNSQLTNTGSLTELLPVKTLLESVESESIPFTDEHQKFDYSDDHLNPLIRGRVKYCITNNDEIVAEKLKYDAYEQVIEKTSTIIEENDSNINGKLKIERVNGKIRSMTYPIYIDNQPFILTHTYNKLGQLIGLGKPDDPNHYVRFEYRPTGELSSESYNNDHIRRYYYNSPGYLRQISDPLLTQDIEYTDFGYGQKGFGDGMVMRTLFKPNWTENADDRSFKIEKSDLPYPECLSALIESGYVSNRNLPIKLFNIDLADKIPLKCKEKPLAVIIAQKLISQSYGHSYAYGNHQELIKAKYFTSDSIQYVEPLKYDSFSKIKGLTENQSKEIWELLTKEGYIIIDKTNNDEFSGIGKRGKSFFRSTLNSDLTSLNSRHLLYHRSIEKLIMKAVLEGNTATAKDFESAYLKWQGIHESSYLLLKNYHVKKSKEISEMLVAKKYIQGNVSDILDSNFKDLLGKYKNYTTDIVKILLRHFAHEIGENPFDVESYDIDANGNHKLFYTGYDRYEFTYKNFTNQISEVKFGQSKLFTMEYDEQGNVIKATHKGISRITYYSASQRPSTIALNDGRVLSFSYDAQGERVIKRVFDSEGKLNTETRYYRDEQGRVLVDRKTIYLPTKHDVTTIYLYGPRGLIGFIRNKEFYNVMTDHAGSVRLVIHNGRVVAAYDYLPYGQIMRTYGSDSESHITYRYTGQEWDEETQLYNFHARLYDPSIGRFYQIDPKSQYFSPYVYGGNSPLSGIDPDGEYFWLLIVTFAFFGAYLGGAAANNRWNPADWDWSDPVTFLGIFAGAVGGGLMPVGAVASASVIGWQATIALGAAVAYGSAWATNGTPNFIKWKFDRPGTWNALFQGFGTGSGIFGGIGVMHKFAKDIAACAKMCPLLMKISAITGISTKNMKTIFLTVSYGAGGSFAYMKGVVANDGKFAFWEWDFTNPGTWISLIEGFDAGSGLPQNFMEIAHGIGKLSNHGKTIKSLLESNPSKLAILKGILKNVSNPLSKTAGSILMGYFMGATATGELDITKWSLSSFSTYEGILNGAFFGKNLQNMLKYARDSKTKNPVRINKTKMRVGTMEFSNIVDKILLLRNKYMHNQALSDLFSNPKKAILENIKHLSPEIEIFLKKGYEKWKDGSNEPPKKLKELVSEEIKRKGDATSEELNKWKKEANDLNKEKNEVYPDRDVEYLNCRKTKRKKRATGRSYLTVKTIPNEATETIIEDFLNPDDVALKNSDPNEFIPIKSSYDVTTDANSNKPKVHLFHPEERHGYTENISWNVETTSKKCEFLFAILGSLATVPVNKLANQKILAAHFHVEYVAPVTKERKRLKSEGDGSKNIPIDELRRILKVDEGKANMLKTAFMKDSDVMVLKTFIIEPKIEGNLTPLDVRKQLYLKSEFSEEELKKISEKFGNRNDDYKIHETVYYLKRDSSLEVRKQIIKDRTTYSKDRLAEVENYLKDLIKSSGDSFITNFTKYKPKPEFKEIVTIGDLYPTTDLNGYLQRIIMNQNIGSDQKVRIDNLPEINKAVKELSDHLLKTYNSNSERFSLSKSLEVNFQSFVYGALGRSLGILIAEKFREEIFLGKWLLLGLKYMQ